MSGIQAFVGNSFLPSDLELVRKFTDYFDTIKDTLLDFDWVHATNARPEEVSVKVLELIEGRNLFIGICTPSEQVLESADIKKTGIFGKKVAFPYNLAWKTSDWLIQEIGLAIGRDMKLILLIEQNVRRPGELQDNIEYIEFDRKFPERSFNSILNMINALQPAISKSLEETRKDSLDAATSTRSEEDLPEILRDPDQSWERRDYEIQFFHGLRLNREDHCAIVSESYVQKLDIDDEKGKNSWHAFCELYRIRLTSDGSIDKIGELARVNKNNGDVQSKAADAYLHYGIIQKRSYICDWQSIVAIRLKKK